MRKLTLLFCLCFGLLFGKSLAEVDIVAFQQLAGRTNTAESDYGFNELYSKISSKFPNSIIVGLGNNYYGSFSSLRNKDKSIAIELKKLNADLCLLSGEDLICGLKDYLEYNDIAGIKTLGANLKSNKEKNLKGIFPSFTIEKSGYKILFIGGCSENLFINEEISTSSIAKAVEAKISEAVRTKNIPNAVVVLLDIPNSFDAFGRQITNEALRKVSKIDGVSAIIMNDNKSSSYSTKTKSIPLINTSMQEGTISHVKLSFDPKFKFLASASSEIITLKKNTTSTETPEIIATSNSVISHKSTRKKPISPLGKIVCRNLAESSGADFVVLPQNIFKNSLPNGKVSDKDVYQIFKTDHRLFTAKVSGKKLKEIFELIIFKNKRYQYYAPELKHNQSEITSLKSSGFFGLSQVKDYSQYSVVTTQEGFDEFLTDGNKKNSLNKSLVSSLLEELRGKILSAEPQN